MYNAKNKKIQEAQAKQKAKDELQLQKELKKTQGDSEEIKKD
jgi:hypothetical protein